MRTETLYRTRITAAIVSLVCGVGGWITEIDFLFYVAVVASIVWIAAVMLLADKAVKEMTKR